MANAHNIASEQEIAFRKFLRATFRARFARDENKVPLTSLKGKTAKAEIKNANTVMAELSEQCRLVKETAKGAVFAFGKGNKKAQISFTQVGDTHVLTMIAA